MIYFLLSMMCTSECVFFPLSANLPIRLSGSQVLWHWLIAESE